MSFSRLRAHWGLVLWGLALACFGFAIALSYRAVQEPDWYLRDLRHPGVVCFNAAAAVAVATLWLRRQGAPPSGSAWWSTVVFGLFCAGVFRLVPPILGESALFETDGSSPGVLYVLLGMVAHAGISAVLSMPYACRVAIAAGRTRPAAEEATWGLAAMTMIAFFVVAALVRFWAQLPP